MLHSIFFAIALWWWPGRWQCVHLTPEEFSSRSTYSVGGLPRRANNAPSSLKMRPTPKKIKCNH